MSYTRADFSACKFNPMLDDSILDEYPVLYEILPPILREQSQLDSIVKFIVMVYDPASPYVVNQKDIISRKDEVLTYLGITDKALADELIKNTNINICQAIFIYLYKFILSREYAAIVALEFCYWESISKLMEPILEVEGAKILTAVQKKSAIKAEVKSDLAMLDQLYKDFFAGDDELKKVAKRARFSPERIGNV